jgi:hypothetical protein
VFALWLGRLRKALSEHVVSWNTGFWLVRAILDVGSMLAVRAGPLGNTWLQNDDLLNDSRE